MHKYAGQRPNVKLTGGPPRVADIAKIPLITARLPALICTLTWSAGMAVDADPNWTFCALAGLAEAEPGLGWCWWPMS
jgi:hypothetical protein